MAVPNNEINADLNATTVATTPLTSTTAKGLVIGLGKAKTDDAGTYDDVD